MRLLFVAAFAFGAVGCGSLQPPPPRSYGLRATPVAVYEATAAVLTGEGWHLVGHDAVAGVLAFERYAPTDGAQEHLVVSVTPSMRDATLHVEGAPERVFAGFHALMPTIRGRLGLRPGFPSPRQVPWSFPLQPGEREEEGG